MYFKETESRSFRPWNGTDPPGKILIIRFHAIGDVAITFPSCASLRENYPHCRIDFLTVRSNAELPHSTHLFDHVYEMTGGVGVIGKLVSSVRWGLTMREQRYDMVIDLQRNNGSRLIRMLAGPKGWGEFDRFSPKAAGLRTLDTFNKAGFSNVHLRFKIPVDDSSLQRAKDRLTESGWNGYDGLVVLNPAGLWVTRNWPLHHYLELARLIRSTGPVTFLMLGTDRTSERAKYLASELGDAAINMTGQTSLAMAFNLIQISSMVISEDSGLMHMAWVSGIPTVALLGSSRPDWSSPLGPHSRCLHSADLPCGACMARECKYGDVHCLSRYTPERVFDLYKELSVIKRASV